MRRFQVFWVRLIFFIFLARATPATAEDALAIITQQSSPIKNLSIDELKRIYLRKNLLNARGNRWIPVNLPLDQDLRKRFSLALFKILPEEQEQYWNEQYFQGITPPEVLASEEAVIRFVAITPGAIGYVYKHSADNRVKILISLPLP